MTEQYVCIMPEIGDLCCWDRAGVGFGVEDLPISPELAAALQAWAEAYTEIDHERDEDRARTCDGLLFSPRLAAHSERGLELARRVKAELPDWKVVYWDETKFEAALRALRDALGSRGIPDRLPPHVRATFEFEVTL